MMKILLANPNSSKDVTNKLLETIQDVPLHATTEIIPLTNPKGTRAIDSTFADYQSAWSFHREILKVVDEQHIDAVVVCGFGNLGVNGLKEMLDIPVLSMSETAMVMAYPLAHRFSVLTTLDSFVPAMEDMIKMQGLDAKCASVRAIDVTVDECVSDREGTFKKLVSSIQGIIKNDGAELIVLGSGGLSGYNILLEKELGIVVLDPAQIAVKVAEMMVETGLKHSKIRKYKKPRQPLSNYYQD